MGTEVSRGSLFEPELVNDLIMKVKGKSSLMKLSNQSGIAFNGNKEFVFTMDSEIDVVAENGKKTHGGFSITPRTVVPIKIEYGARISDEFMFATEKERINILKAFNDGFAKKVAKGFDIMAMHGLNPRTNQASTVIGTNHFDSIVTQTVNFSSAQVEENIESAIQMIMGAEGDVSGMAMSTTFAGALAQVKVNGVKQFPQLAWGGSPDSINGLKVDVNRTVETGTDVKDKAIIGDFENMFKWGYGKDVFFKVIEYGDPDNSGKDLQGYNQIYLRGEAYIGWGILDPTSFVRVVEA